MYVSLGPEEFEQRRVTSAATVLGIWRSLVLHADATVLKHKRDENPEREEHWRLRFVDHSKQKATGPIFEISKVSQPDFRIKNISLRV